MSDIPYEFSNKSDNSDNQNDEANVFSFNKHEQDLMQKPYLNMENMQKNKQDSKKFKQITQNGKVETEFTEEYAESLINKILNSKLQYNQK